MSFQTRVTDFPVEHKRRNFEDGSCCSFQFNWWLMVVKFPEDKTNTTQKLYKSNTNIHPLQGLIYSSTCQIFLWIIYKMSISTKKVYMYNNVLYVLKETYASHSHRISSTILHWEQAKYCSPAGGVCVFVYIQIHTHLLQDIYIYIYIYIHTYRK